MSNKIDPIKLNQPLIILIVGASGSGKTTALQAIEKLLPAELIDINNFDDIGIPSLKVMNIEYVSPKLWQEAATKIWIEKLTSILDKRFIFLEGSYNPKFAVNCLRENSFQNHLVICIDLPREIRDRRLIEQRMQPELVTQDMENFAQLLKLETIDLKGKIIDSSTRQPIEVAKKIIDFICLLDNHKNT